jgi:hypothetical protein
MQRSPSEEVVEAKEPAPKRVRSEEETGLLERRKIQQKIEGVGANSFGIGIEAPGAKIRSRFQPLITTCNTLIFFMADDGSVDIDTLEVRLKIKAVEFCLRNDGSRPGDDIRELVQMFGFDDKAFLRRQLSTYSHEHNLLREIQLQQLKNESPGKLSVKGTVLLNLVATIFESFAYFFF